MEKTLKNLRNQLKNACEIMGKHRKYRNASVMIPIVEIDKAPHILFQVRSEHIRQGGEISFPGGMMESSDEGDYEHTAVRETVEELGITHEQIDMIGYVGTYVASSDMTIDVYAGVLKIDKLDQLTLSEEVASVFTVPLKELQHQQPEIYHMDMDIHQRIIEETEDGPIEINIEDLGLPARYQKMHYKRMRRLFFYNYEGRVIWGMTGEMLYEFLELLNED